MEKTLNDLLQKAKEMVAKYPLCDKKENAMNPFRLLEIQRREVYLCRVLAKLIDPMVHENGAAFLKLFFEKVLNLAITDAECEKAAVYTEYVIDEKRRIDIYIQSDSYNVPIEAKVDAEDQKAQLLDYSKYAQNAKTYYLTLDGHQPSEYSIARGEDGGRLLEEDYCCISFSKDIVSWIDACLAISENAPETKGVLQQLRDILEENTTEQREKRAVEIAEELINNPDNFRAANAIADGLKKAKIRKMQEFFDAIYEKLEKYGAIPADKEAISAYYDKKGSTYPGITIPLYVNGNQNFALRMEIDYRLYYGICNYRKDKAPYYNDHACKDTNEGAKANKKFVEENLMPVKTRTLNSSQSFYWWRYLPSDMEKSSKTDLNFQDENDTYINLYDSEKFNGAVEKVCKAVIDFLEKVNRQE